jgi:hypothetical protein
MSVVGEWYFSFSTSKGLRNAVFFYNGNAFGLRGGDEQIGLLDKQFSLGYDSAKSRIRKNAQKNYGNYATN